MDKRTTILYISDIVKDIIERPLNKKEYTELSNIINVRKTSIFSKNTANGIIKILCEQINNKRSVIQKRKSDEKNLEDMDKYFNDTIHSTDDGEIPRQKAITTVAATGTPVNINSIFGTANPIELQKIFNPSPLYSKAHFILDRKYTSEINNNETLFTWNLSYHPAASDNSIITRAPLKNISSIKMYPFRFPNTINAVTFAKRLSVNIEEIGSQAYQSSCKNNQFHFLFEINTEVEDNGVTVLKLGDIGQNISKFEFFSKIQYLESITLSFGNPIIKLKLDRDRDVCDISSVGNQTLITVDTPHKCSIGDYISIDKFTTADIAKDNIEIELINNIHGWEITAITANTITIDVDISSATLLNVKVPIYFENRRFIIPIEVEYYTA